MPRTRTRPAGPQPSAAPLWRRLEHAGVEFQAPYRAIGRPVVCGGRRVALPPAAEEPAAQFARLTAQQPRTARFRANFMRDWQKLAPPKCRAGAAVDLSPLVKGPAEVKGKGQSKGKAKPAAAVAKVDGEAQPVANHRAEAAGVFVGRGDHPLAGRIKRRLRPQDVTLNLARGARVPPGAWRAVVHDPTVTWLASWSDPLTGKVKYMRLAAAARPQQAADVAKFDLARRVAARLPELRRRNAAALQASGGEAATRVQLACCVALIDTFAIRVGSREEDGERRVPTVGAATLRTDNITVSTTPGAAAWVELDFVGKDAVPFAARAAVPPPLARALGALVRAGSGKAAGSKRVFDRIDAAAVNGYLARLLPGEPDLTAKVLRTCRAGVAFERGLTLGVPAGALPPAAARLLFRVASAQVAALCNHVRAGGGGPGRRQEVLEALRHRVVAAAATARQHQQHQQHQQQQQLPALARSVAEASAGLGLSTAQANYIDPRIGAAFCRRHGLPWERVMTQPLRTRFAWAADTPAKFHWGSRP
jgi:DNA topoisomerase-1